MLSQFLQNFGNFLKVKYINGKKNSGKLIQIVEQAARKNGQGRLETKYHIFAIRFFPTNYMYCNQFGELVTIGQ